MNFDLEPTQVNLFNLINPVQPNQPIHTKKVDEVVLKSKKNRIFAVKIYLFITI
jgi:hypothetical protein